MRTLVIIVVGAAFGALWGQFFGAVVGAVLAWLLLNAAQQARSIAQLQSQLQDLRQVQRPATALAPSGNAIANSAESDIGGSSDPGTVPSAALKEGIESAEQRPARPFATSKPPGSAVPQRPDTLAAAKAWLFGGNTIVKAGVAILFIGLAFLAKFATEHVHVPVEMRLATIGGVAVILLALGWRLRLQRPGYAQVLQGGAVAVLYLTLFVAFRFYGVLAVAPVFGLMAVVAALAAALAVLQDARALAVMGALGGFAAPLLVSTGSGDHVALFSYYLVLDLGIAAVAWVRTWRSLNLIGFLGTFVIGTAWGALRYEGADYASSQAFLIIFFLLFAAILLMPARQQRATANAPQSRGWPQDTWVNGSLLFGLPTITFALQYGLVRGTESGAALSALAMACAYVLLALALRARAGMALIFEASLAIATVFLTLVIPFALDARSTAGAWALEGAGLVWLGFRQSRVLPRCFGYALLLLAGGSLCLGYSRHGVPTQVFNAIFFNALMAAAASLAAAFFVKRFSPASGEPAGLAGADGPPGGDSVPVHRLAGPSAVASVESLAEPLLLAWGTLGLLTAAAVQIDAFATLGQTLAAWLVSFSLIALLYAGLSTRLGWQRLALPTLAHAPLHALGLSVSALDMARPMDGGGWLAWPVALLTHAVLLRWVAARWPPAPRHVVHALGALVLAALGALQGRAFTAGWGDLGSAWAWLGWLVVPAAVLLALPRPASAARWPISAAPAAYQSSAAAVLALVMLLWTLLANLVSKGSSQPLPYLPLVNPLDLAVGVALLATGLWMRSAAALPVWQSRLAWPGTWSAALLSSVGFVWLNAMLIRAFHHLGGVPFHIDAWAGSLAVQTGTSLLWSITALVLMWLSARRSARPPWMVGAALLGAVVVKLLLVDLSGSGGVTRIVSFIGVGVLMLVIGYVAPLPAQEKSHAAT